MFYDYWCPDCDITQEVQHGMTEEPEIKCPKCGSIMKKLISGGSGFIMRTGGTRGSVQKYKKVDYTPTPSEGAAMRGQAILKEKVHNDNMDKDPYYQFRNL